MLGNCRVFGIPGKLTPELAPREMSSPNCKAQELCWERKSALSLSYAARDQVREFALPESANHCSSHCLGSSIHTARVSVWLAGLPLCWLSGFQLFSHKCWEQGVRRRTEITS